MKIRCFSKSAASVAVSLAAVALTPSGARAQFTTPNYINTPGAVTSLLGGTTLVNQGLVGVGRFSASSLDSFGETFGSVSGLQITGWANNGNGSYSGTFNILPDRGYNNGAFYSDYAARIQQVGFSFTPYTGNANIGGATIADKIAAQNQIAFTTPVSGVKFTYDDPNTGTTRFTTGIDPAAGNSTIFGTSVPYVTTYTGLATPSSVATTTYNGINKLALDAEALVLKPDGSGYIGDEYGGNIYYFNSSKKIVGVLGLPDAVVPHAPSNTVNFGSGSAPLNGRRNNQGFEGVSLSPDGTRLFAMMQSATVQDSNNSSNQTRLNTRVFVYDVSGNAMPTNPIGEYALQLPTFRSTGNGSAVNSTAAQSEVVAIDDHRFLVLSRDGNGLGNSSANQSVYKSVLLVDTQVGSPTNFVLNASMNMEGGTITTAPGVLNTNLIKPLSWVEAVNLLNTNQLAKFNIDVDTGSGPVSKLTLSEKWEGMSLVSANDTNAPNDYFLFVANDNDFITSAGTIVGPDGTNVSYNAFNGYGAGRIPGAVGSPNNENDTMFLAYRVTVVPEPSTVVLGVLGAGALLFLRRRKSQ